MNYKVVIKHGWSADVFFYSSIESARRVFECAKKDGDEARIYMRSGLAWILYED